MQAKGNKIWPVAVAVIVVAALLFAGGYALGRLHGQDSAAQASAASSQPASSAPAAQPQATASSVEPASAQPASEPTATSPQPSQSSSTGASAGASSSENQPSPGTSASQQSTAAPAATATQAGITVQEDGTYTSKDEVALYIHTYGHLPSNYISKTKAKKAGWVSSKGNLDEVLPGMSIGGSEFYNYEGQLPDAPGRTWTECDINYEGGFRGAERIVFSSDGLVFYTGDHYETFEQLY